MLICPGGQAALAACLRGLAAPGAPVIVESPTYIGALAAARAQGLQPVPVPVDDKGIRPDLLADALQTLRRAARLPAAAVRQPARGDTRARAARPGARSRARRRRVHRSRTTRSATARSHPRRRRCSPTTATATSCTSARSRRPSAPGLRIAAVVARGPAAARLRAARIVEDLFVAGPLQEAALELVGAPAWRAHLKRLRRVLRERRDALAAALDHAGPLPEGGMNLWVRLDTDDRELASAPRRPA